jgi:prolyl-tRNA synthetase
MKQSAIHIKTLKESPFEGKMESQHLMFRAGMMKKNGAGDYSLMPYGVAIYQELKAKVDSLFTHIGYQNISTLEYKERELLTQLRSDIVSYKDLPLFVQSDSLLRRDKHSVKHGLIRSRMAPIKVLQAITADKTSHENAMKGLWDQLFEFHSTLGIPHKMTDLYIEEETATGYGTWIPSEHGDTTYYDCKSCAYCSDEIGAKWRFEEGEDIDHPATEEVLTPDVKTIADLEVFLSIGAESLMKTLLLQCEMKGKPLTIAVVIRGDRELNLAKVAKYLGKKSSELELVTDINVVEAAGTIVGFAGPIGLTDVMVLVDEELANGRAMVTGANKKDYHLKHVVYGRDFESKHLGDFSTVKEGDACPVCGQPLYKEIGYTLITLNTYEDRLSKKMDIKFKNDQMKDQLAFITTGSIDLYKLLTAYLDSHKDEGGFILKEELSPFDVHIVIPNIKKEEQCVVADQIAFELESKGKKVLVDDRKGGAGGKFKDSDLLGIPVRITAGKLAGEGIVELKYRHESEKCELTIKEVLDKF